MFKRKKDPNEWIYTLSSLWLMKVSEEEVSEAYSALTTQKIMK